ncbi:MAG: hypothetical protein RR975_08405, partial [Clostridia bacterium]
ALCHKNHKRILQLAIDDGRAGFFVDGNSLHVLTKGDGEVTISLYYSLKNTFTNSTVPFSMKAGDFFYAYLNVSGKAKY